MTWRQKKAEAWERVREAVREAEETAAQSPERPANPNGARAMSKNEKIDMVVEMLDNGSITLEEAREMMRAENPEACASRLREINVAVGAMRVEDRRAPTVPVAESHPAGAASRPPKRPIPRRPRNVRPEPGHPAMPAPHQRGEASIMFAATDRPVDQQYTDRKGRELTFRSLSLQRFAERWVKKYAHQAGIELHDVESAGADVVGDAFFAVHGKIESGKWRVARSPRAAVQSVIRWYARAWILGWSRDPMRYVPQSEAQHELDALVVNKPMEDVPFNGAALQPETVATLSELPGELMLTAFVLSQPHDVPKGTKLGRRRKAQESQDSIAERRGVTQKTISNHITRLQTHTVMYKLLLQRRLAR